MGKRVETARSKRGLLISIIFIITLVADWTTKIWARRTLDGNTFSYWNEFLVFQHSENTGAFLSLGSSLDPRFRFWIFTVGITLLMGGMLYYLFRTRNLPRTQVIAYSFVCAGGIGNLADRVMKESVTDFINMGIGPVRTGVFNIADMAIMLGTFILIYEGFRGDKISDLKADKKV